MGNHNVRENFLRFGKLHGHAVSEFGFAFIQDRASVGERNISVVVAKKYPPRELASSSLHTLPLWI